MNITGGKISIGSKLNIDEEGNIVVGGSMDSPGLISRNDFATTSFFPLGIVNEVNGQYGCVNKGGLGVGYITGDTMKETTTIDVNGIRTNKIFYEEISQISLVEAKKNFEKLENGLDIVNNTEIYKYHFKNQSDNDKKHIGTIIGGKYKYSKDITTIDKDGKENGIDLYAMISVAYKAIQEQQKIIEELQEKVKVLEKGVA